MAGQKLLLAVNAGSSSVKASLYRANGGQHDPELIADCSVSGLTSPPAKLALTLGDGTAVKDDEELGEVKSQTDAFDRILDALIDSDEVDALSSADDIALVAHRVVHGGDFRSAQEITSDTLHTLDDLTALAPLHNAPALEMIRRCRSPSSSSQHKLDSARNVAVFDTSFHATLPDAVSQYAISPAVARARGLRKYGFHGISYASILSSVASHLKKSAGETSLIALHLGSGASACCIRAGKSIDTTMGLTPLSGLPGATRSGDVDPALVFHYATHPEHGEDGADHEGGGDRADAEKDSDEEQQDEDDEQEGANIGRPAPSSSHDGLHITVAEEVLNKRAGWKSLTGTTDFGEIAKLATSASDPTSTSAADASGDGGSGEPDGAAEKRKACKLAFDMLVDRLAKVIGGYFVALDGDVDALVFAGGIGERSTALRSAVVGKVSCLGFSIADDDEQRRRERDAERQIVWDISPAAAEHEGEKKKVLVCRTDEQLQMARGCARFLD